MTNWIETHNLNNLECPICKQTKWSVSETLFKIEELKCLKEYAFAVVPIACLDCGYTFFINALAESLVDPSDFRDGYLK